MCSPSLVVDIPSRSPEEDPHGPVYSADHRDSPIAVRFQVVDAPVMRVVQFLWWQKTAVIPQLQFITVVDIYFVAQRQFPLVQTTQLTIEISLSFVFGGRCPCLQVHFSSWC